MKKEIEDLKIQLKGTHFMSNKHKKIFSYSKTKLCTNFINLLLDANNKIKKNAALMKTEHDDLKRQVAELKGIERSFC